MNKGASVREQDKQHISRKFRVNTILTTSRKEKKKKRNVQGIFELCSLSH